jgi:hypothetical protein
MGITFKLTSGAFAAVRGSPVYGFGLSRGSRSGAMSNCRPPQRPHIPRGSEPHSVDQPVWPPPGQEPPRAGPAQRSRTPIVIMAVMAAAVVVVAGVLIWVFAFEGSNASESSAEDQIRALMKSVDNNLNNADAGGLASLLCGAQKNSPGRHVHTDDQLRKQRDVVGLETSSVADIHLAGNQATASVTVSWSKAPQHDVTETVQFVRENGGWKVCGPG